MERIRLQVSAPHGEDYPIYIAPGGLVDDMLLTALVPRKRVAIITNVSLVPHYAEALAAQLPDASLITMPDGEAHKTMSTVADLCREVARAGLDRGSTIIALGGGVVGDTAGFVAASYMRGVRFVQIPTSLLAMVDSSVGGKVGVDLPEGKNLVGAFKQPSAVLIDPSTLATLPAREWRNGMAEIIKHGLIADAELLNPALHTPERAVELIQRAVQVKIDVVQQDPYEENIRQYLNLGHTFGHAIERVTEYQWAHGEAVAMGVVAAMHLSHDLGLIGKDFVTQVETMLAETGLPTRLGGLSPDALWEAMATDKKWRGGKSRFILLAGAQQPVIREGVPREAVIAVLEALR
ncbi:MAG: 3-dehydroquinate synthase [Phototrophicaceae bacterium]|jgi:3-dehydroquinate synthase